MQKVEDIPDGDFVETVADIKQKPIGYVNKYFYAVGCPAHAKRIASFSMDDALSLTNAMNGKLFIAHPGGAWGSPTETILDYYIKKGVHGIEVRNYWNTEEQNQKFDSLARRFSLIKSGGSDYHGSKGLSKIGIYDRPENQLPNDILEELWESLPK